MTQSEANMVARAIVREWQRSMAAETETLLTAEECAQLLKVSVSYIRQHTDEIPHIKIGGSVRFPKNRVLHHFIN